MIKARRNSLPITAVKVHSKWLFIQSIYLSQQIYLPWMCGENCARSVEREESKSARLFQLDGHQPITSFFSVSCYCISLSNHQSCGSSWLGQCKGKENFFSVQVLSKIPMDQSELVKNPFCTVTCGRAITHLHHCFHSNHCHLLQFCSTDVGALFSMLYLPNPATGLQLIHVSYKQRHFLL